MKKILIVNNILGYYGAENVLINLVNNINLQKYDVTVLTLIQCDSSRLAKDINYKYIFNARGVLSKIKNKIKLIMNFKLLAKIYCSGYDIAIAFKMGECAKIVAYCNSFKKFCWIHSNVSELKEACSYSFNNLYEEQFFLTRFNSFIAVSKHCAESFKRKYKGEYNVEVIYNPINIKKILIDSGEILSDSEKELFDESIPVIGTVARIDNLKRIDRLIHISERLQKENIKHKLIIIGSGVDYKKLFNEIKKKNLNNVFMIGFQKNPYKFMRRFNLYVCSSQSESYSIVVNEALALKVPVISTKCGGPEEVLQYGKYGILTENNEDDLYYAVKKFCLEGISYISEYDATISMKKFIKEIDELFEGKL